MSDKWVVVAKYVSDELSDQYVDSPVMGESEAKNFIEQLYGNVGSWEWVGERDGERVVCNLADRGIYSYKAISIDDPLYSQLPIMKLHRSTANGFN